MTAQAQGNGEAEAKAEATGPDTSKAMADVLVKAVVEDLTVKAGQHNAKATALSAASGSVEDVTAAILADPAANLGESHKAEVTAWQAAMDALDKATEAINRIAGKVAAERIAEGSGNVETLTAERDALAADYLNTLKTFKSLLSGRYGEDVTNAIVASLPALTGKGRGKGTSKSGGSAAWRIRNFDFSVKHGAVWQPLTTTAKRKDKEGKVSEVTVSNTAAVMEYTGASADDIRAAFAEAQGTTDSDSFKPEVTFTLTVPGKDADTPAKTYTIRAVKNVEGAAEEANEKK